MFLNPITSPIDEPIYRPTNHYKYMMLIYFGKL